MADVGTTKKSAVVDALRKKHAAAITAAVKKQTNVGHRRLRVADLEPNPWNPNKLTGTLLEKLEAGLVRTLEKSGGSLPPIVVRPHPERDGAYQIIDGFHRWKVFKKLAKEDIDAFVLDVDDSTARILTINLNYLRGEKDPEKYTSVLGDLLDQGMSMDDLEKLIPEDNADILDLFQTYDDGAALRALLRESEAKKADSIDGEKEDEDNTWIDLKFRVSVSQGRVIQEELKRIAKAIPGNNPEGRALEYMAVMSSQSDIPHDVSGIASPAKKPVVKKAGKP